jgi:predicted DNA-binding protein (UPF0251 family)
MPRRKCCRRVKTEPVCRFFKPAGVPVRVLEQVFLTVDEYEALRLADYKGLYHEEAAARMNVSRPTFGRIVSQARSRVATALVRGQALRIEGGVFELDETRHPGTDRNGQYEGRGECIGGWGKNRVQVERCEGEDEGLEARGINRKG